MVCSAQKRESHAKEQTRMTEKNDPVEVIAAAEPHGDVDDLIFAKENGWLTSDR